MQKQTQKIPISKSQPTSKEQQKRTPTTSRSSSTSSKKSRTVKPEPVKPQAEKSNETLSFRQKLQILSKPSEKKSEKSDNAEIKKKVNYTQDLIPIKRIIGGMVHTLDNRYVKILEIEPIYYNTLTNKKKNNIIYCFEKLLQTGPSNMQMQVISYKTDISEYLLNIRQHRAKETDRRVIKQSNNLEKHAKRLASTQSNEKHYFLIYEYEGDYETQRKSNDIESIYQTMKDMEIFIRSEFMAMGNKVVDYDLDDENGQLTRILYNFFNRKTCEQESFEERMLRIISDDKKFNHTTEAEMTEIRDFIAPKGVERITPDIIIMDGLYYTYLCVKGGTHPSAACGGWIDNYIGDAGIDLNIYSRRLDPEKQIEKLGRVSRFKELRANDKDGNASAQQDFLKEKGAADYMADKIKNENQGIYDVLIMFTVTADTLSKLKSKKSKLIKRLKRDQMQVETSYLWVLDGLVMSTPLLAINKKIMERNSHNYLTESLSTLYPYNGCKMYDPKGWLLGVNATDGSLMVINNFNTKTFINANMCIFGSSGSGKTYTELLIGNHTRLNGIRTIYLYPEKAEEAQKACKAIGGTYIQLHPASEDCINIMEIRPFSVLDESKKENFDYRSVSLLTQKTIDLKVFTELLMGADDRITVEEDSLLDIAIANTYARFGITTDNNSIYEAGSGSKLKLMPTIGDLYNETLKEPKLSRISILYTPFVTGTSKNMNRQTNVDLDNMYMVFDCDKKAIGAKLQPAYLYIAFSLIKNLMRTTRLENDILFFDEGWQLLENRNSAKQVEELFTLIRGYGGSAVFGTQRIGKTINGPNAECGKSIIENSELMIFLKMKEKEIETLDQLIGLTEEDKNTILTLNRGEGIIVYRGSKLPVFIKSSVSELINFTTDAETLRRIKANQLTDGEEDD